MERTAALPYIGIDFGTSNSAVAWYNPRTGQAEILWNAEGEQKTPSVVYFGDRQPVVGSPAEQLLQDEQEWRRVVVSVKRDLVAAPMIALPGKLVRAIDVAAEILRKLKRDAEELHFHQAVRHAVITCPASFDILQREKIEEAGRLAGFEEVVLLEEPVAAALAYAHAGLKVGNRILVYDLGGGTFDVTVLVREADGTFRPAMEPRGLAQCGGDDFDRALYDHCQARAYEELGRGIRPDGLVDLHFLRLCRQRKESLSTQERSTFSSLLASDNGVAVFKQTIDRPTFEGLIEDRINSTVRLTKAAVEEARASAHEVDTVVLIGGSSKVPLVWQRLQHALPVEPQKWHQADVAVALGAAYHAHRLWGATIVEPTPAERYRQAVAAAWADRTLDDAKMAELDVLARALGLSAEQVAAVEREVLGGTKEEILRLARLARYRKAAVAVWTSWPPDEVDVARAKMARLDALAQELQLGGDEAAALEREVMGGAKEAILERLIADRKPKPEDVVVPEPRPEDFALVRTLAGRRGRVRSVAISADGRIVAAAGGDDTIHVWDVRSGDLLCKLTAHVGAVTAIAISPDSHVLASGGADATLRLWDLRSGTMLGYLGEPESAAQPRARHSDWIMSLAFSWDGQRLASGSADKTAKLWNMSDSELMHTLPGHATGVLSVAFDPEGRVLATGGGGEEIKLWDVWSGRLIRTLSTRTPRRMVLKSLQGVISGGQGASGLIKSGQTLLRGLAPGGSTITAIAYGPDPSFLYSGASDGMIWAWNLRLAEGYHTQQGHGDFIWTVTVSRDGELLATAGADATIKLWDARSGSLRQTLVGDEVQVRSVAFENSGRVLVSGGDDGSVNLWAQPGARGAGPSAGALPRTGTVATKTQRDAVAELEERIKGRRYSALPGDIFQFVHSLSGHADYVGAIALFPDEQLLLSGSADRTIRLWNVESMSLVYHIAQALAPVECVTVSPDGELIAAATAANSVSVWRFRTQELIRTVTCIGTITSAAISPSGQVLYTCSTDNALVRWDLQTGFGSKINPWSWATPSFRGSGYPLGGSPGTRWGYPGSSRRVLALSPDGDLIACGGADKIVTLVDSSVGEAIRTLSGHQAPIRALAFNRDGDLLATGSADKTVKLWDVRTGKLLQTLQGHAATVRTVALSGDYQLASGSDDGAIVLWNLHKGEALYHLPCGAPVTSIALSSSGRLLIGAVKDRTIKIWKRPDGVDGVR